MRCDRLDAVLPAVAVGEADLGGAERHHVEHCLRCQAVMAQHRRVHSSLKSIRDEPASPTPALLERSLEALESAGLPRVGGSRRVAVVIGVVGAVCAVGVLAVLIRSRWPRRPTTALTG